MAEGVSAIRCQLRMNGVAGLSDAARRLSAWKRRPPGPLYVVALFRPVTHTDVLRASELVAGRLCLLALVLHATATTGSDHRCKACRVATHLPGPVSTAARQSVCRGRARRA